MTDKTRVPSSFDSVAQVRSVKPNRHARDESNQLKRHRFNRAARPGHAPTRPLARCSATPIRLPRPSHASRSLPSAHCSPGGTPGILPFAGLLPRAGGLDISAEPGPRAVCAARPPRLIFVGVIDRRVETLSKGGRSRTFLNYAASASGLHSRLRSVSPTPLPGNDPALSFASCRVVDALPRIRSGSTPIGSSASGNPLPRSCGRGLLSAHGFVASFPATI